MIRLERDENVGVFRADRIGRVVGEVDPAHGQADVVEHQTHVGGGNHGLDLRFHFVGNASRLLDARAGRRTQMQAYFAGIDRRKEVPPRERHQRKRAETDREPHDNEAPALGDGALKHARVTMAQRLEPRLEASLETHDPSGEAAARRPRLLSFPFFFQQIHRQRGNQRAREKVRGAHREHDRLGHRHEQIARHAGEQEHRHEHDADGQCRDEGRHGNLACPGENRIVQRGPSLQMVRDVFDGDGGVVHENAHREREPAERHDVDRLTERRQRNQRREHRERNGDGDDERGAPASQKQQDHGGGQARGDERFAHHAGNGRFHEDRLVGQRGDFQRAGQAGGDLRQQIPDLLNDRERRGAAGLLHGEECAALAVCAHDVGLRGITVDHMGDVAHVHHTALLGLDRQVVERRHTRRAAVHRDVVFARTDLGGAARQDQVLRVDGVDDVDRCEPLRLQGFRVELHHDLADLPAVGQRHGRALHGGELRADEAVAEVVKRLLRQRLARQSELEHGHRRRAVRDDVRRQRAGRHDAQDRRGIGRRFGDRAIDVCARVEKHLHDGHAVERLGLDVIDVVDVRRQGALVVRRDPVRHVFGREAVIRPDDADDGNIDVRKDVRRRAQDRERPEDKDQHGEHDERVGAPEGQIDDPHDGVREEAMTRKRHGLLRTDCPTCSEGFRRDPE